MTFSTGERLGPYELVTLNGAEGMGQVYRNDFDGATVISEF